MAYPVPSYPAPSAPAYPVVPPPYSGDGAPVSAQNSQYIRDTRLETFIGEHKISDYFAKKIGFLKGFDIVLVLDDSGSMNGMVEDDAGNAVESRWDELKRRVSVIIDLTPCLDRDGIDVHFLNGGSFTNVKDPGFVESCPVFRTGPRGVTPLESVCERIFASATEKPTLMIIMTDGLPSDAHGRSNQYNMTHFKTVIRSKPKNYHVVFGACTSEDDVMTYLNSMDDIDGVDIVDDYHSEKCEVQKIQGKSFTFTFGDYIMKTMLGAIDKQTDMLDEIPLPGRGGCMGCVVC